DMRRYRKLPGTQGYVPCTEVLPKGTPMLIRTLQCDMDDLVSDDDIYILIGMKGEVSPIAREKFEKGYSVSDQPFEIKTEYFPHIRNLATGQIIDLRKYARTCTARGEVMIYAKRLTQTVKVFTLWDRDTYMLGKPGDYLVMREDDNQDVYTIPQDMFSLLYEEV
ncbi:MAG: recombinase RecJ, partial [Clostridia bacterium]|nr:recombinase RecJ [Clostridia bacterium]